GQRGAAARAAALHERAMLPFEALPLDFDLNEEQKLLKQTVREFAEGELAPHAREWDEKQEFPREVFTKLGELGLMGVVWPVDYGGAGLGTLDYAIVMEELSPVGAGVAVVRGVTGRAKSKKGSSAFIVERGTRGFHAGKKEDKLGVRSSDTSELVLEDCHVPATNLLGEEGHGFIDTLRVLDRGRIG